MSEMFPEHRWFAWLPVDTEDRGWRWLRFLWRKGKTAPTILGHGGYRYWTYRVEKR